jgi:hypothetical protein
MAFDYTKDKLELENGEFAVWRDEDKAAVALRVRDRIDLHAVGHTGLGTGEVGEHPVALAPEVSR